MLRNMGSGEIVRLLFMDHLMRLMHMELVQMILRKVDILLGVKFPVFLVEFLEILRIKIVTWLRTFLIGGEMEVEI